LADYSEQDDEGGLGLLLRSAGPDTTPLPGCEERVLGRLLAAIEARESGYAPHATGRPKRIRLLRIVSAAAAVIVAGLVAWWLIEGNVPAAKADFAEMLRRVRQATTVSYDVTMRRPGHPEVKAQFLMAFPGRSRVTFPDGRTHILNWAEGKLLVLNPVTKIATLLRITAAFEDHLENLRKTGESQGQFAGYEMLNGRRVVVYQVPHPQGATRVWADPEQEMPVQMEIRSCAEDGQETITFLDNFRWNEPVSDSLFALEAPAGYTFQRPQSSLTEESLIDLLRACANMQHSSFPGRLDSKTVLALVLKTYPEAFTLDTVQGGGNPTLSDVGDEIKETYRVCSLATFEVVLC
jgi:outer membrane lipoprotein-sorting protein